MKRNRNTIVAKNGMPLRNHRSAMARNWAIHQVTLASRT